MSLFNKGEYLDNGKYQIVKVLGTGGFGITYLANKCKKGSTTDKQVVLKFLDVEKFVREGKGKDFGKRQQEFINEALTLASFDHPHIVKSEKTMISVLLEDELKDATDESRLQGMVMEYIDGKDLIWHLETNGIFTVEKALQIIEQIGSALDHIHNKNLLHRDIKPQNIMIRDSTGDAVLIDFGLARRFSLEESMTMTNMMTPAFAPPEQFENKARFTPALDIYSLASTFYVLVTKNNSPYTPLPAFMHSKMMMQVGMPLQSPQTYNGDLSDQICEGILWAMEFDATKRPQNISEWLKKFGLLKDQPEEKETSEIVEENLPITSDDENFFYDQLPTDNPIFEKLESYLKYKKWKEADLETDSLMLRFGDKENKDYLNYNDCRNFPKKELRTIDQLWLKYSNNHFGLSVQKQIYLQYRGNWDYDRSSYKKMANRIGWYNQEKSEWLSYSQYTFNTDAPLGHLPSLCNSLNGLFEDTRLIVEMIGAGMIEGLVVDRYYSFLFSKL